MLTFVQWWGRLSRAELQHRGRTRFRLRNGVSVYRPTKLLVRLPAPSIPFDSRSAALYVPAVPTRDSITLRGMRFSARVGVLPHEQQLAQPLEADLTVWLAGPAWKGAESVVDYRELYDLVARRIASPPLTYLEELASDIAAEALRDTRLARVRVALRKPHVALPGPLDHAEVVVDRDRA